MKYWQKAVEDFYCMRRGFTMHWEVSDKVRLFIDDDEIDLEAEI